MAATPAKADLVLHQGVIFGTSRERLGRGQRWPHRKPRSVFPAEGAGRPQHPSDQAWWTHACPRLRRCAPAFSRSRFRRQRARGMAMPQRRRSSRRSARRRRTHSARQLAARVRMRRGAVGGQARTDPRRTRSGGREESPAPAASDAPRFMAEHPRDKSARTRGQRLSSARRRNALPRRNRQADRPGSRDGRMADDATSARHQGRARSARPHHEPRAVRRRSDGVHRRDRAQRPRRGQSIREARGVGGDLPARRDDARRAAS